MHSLLGVPSWLDRTGDAVIEETSCLWDMLGIQPSVQGERGV